MKIAIIDSGINNIFSNIVIKQYRIYNQKVIIEKPKDYIGHGTAVASIILREHNNAEIISICPGINNEGIPDNIIDAGDLAMAIDVAISENVDLINVSMGTTMFSRRYKLDDVCRKAKDKDILIIAAESPEGYPSLPWGCHNVVRVKAIKGKDYSISIDDNENKFTTLVVHGDLFRILTMENKKYYASGNSYAAPYIASLLIKEDPPYTIEKILKVLNLHSNDYLKLEKMLNEKVDLINNSIPYINQKLSYKNIVILPFIKETHSLVRFKDVFGYNIVGIVDSPKKGTINKDAGEILNLGKMDIPIYKNINDIREQVDLLIIGYMDEIYKYDKRFDLDLILKENLEKTKWDVFSFIPVNKDWKKLYQQEGLKIKSPQIIDESTYRDICEIVKYKVPISKPVIGVFGTSSSQGKFTLQIRLKLALQKKGYSCFFLSTENHGEFLGANFVFADGYANNHTIKLDAESTIDYLKRVMVYIDNSFDDNLILVGGQSRLIPFDINEQTFMRNAVFLEGTLPDLSVLVINPLIDVKEYIIDTINALKSIYKCKTIALAFSNYTVKADDKGRLSKIYLSNQEIEEIANEFKQLYDLPCGCILNDNYIDYLTDIILASCG